jgi:hypothetical protein
VKNIFVGEEYIRRRTAVGTDLRSPAQSLHGHGLIAWGLQQSWIEQATVEVPIRTAGCICEVEFKPAGGDR